MLNNPISRPLNGRNRSAPPIPTKESKPIPHGAHTGAATPKNAPIVPDLVKFPLNDLFASILKNINETTRPNSMLIVRRIVVECGGLEIIPPLYKENKNDENSFSDNFSERIIIVLKFFESMLIEKKMNTVNKNIKEYFLLVKTFFIGSITFFIFETILKIMKSKGFPLQI